MTGASQRVRLRAPEPIALARAAARLASVPGIGEGRRGGRVEDTDAPIARPRALLRDGRPPGQLHRERQRERRRRPPATPCGRRTRLGLARSEVGRAASLAMSLPWPRSETTGARLRRPGTGGMRVRCIVQPIADRSSRASTFPRQGPGAGAPRASLLGDHSLRRRRWSMGRRPVHEPGPVPVGETRRARLADGLVRDKACSA